MTEPSVRVVELSSPFTRFAGRLLVGLGHEVVLVEPPQGDPARYELDGLAFAHWHAGKRTRPIDLTTTRGRVELAELLAGADVLLDGSPADAEVVGEFPVPRHPTLVHLRVTPFGTDGPRRDWAGTDLVVAALGGMLAQVGDPEGPPLNLPQGQAEQLAGVNAAIGALLGLRARRRTGQGQRIEVSALESVAASLEAGALVYLHEDRVAPRPGRVHPLVPHGLFRAADGHLGGGLGGNPRMWDDLLAWLIEAGAQADLDDPRWNEGETRQRQQAHIFKVVQDYAAKWPKAEFAQEAQARKLPWAAVDRPPELLENPQLLGRGFFVDVRAQNGKTRKDLGFPFAFPEGRRSTELAAPELGAPAADWQSPSRFLPGEAPGVSGPALTGVRVLDLSWVLAGPYCTRILADHGAEVIKVESASRPDPTRFAPFMHLSRGPHDDPDTSGYFNNVNRNKRSITLDLRTEDGLAVLRKLIAASDVVVENFSAKVMRKLGLDYAAMRELRDDVIYVSMSGMGHTGPRSGWVSYADTISASAGLTGLTGWGPDEVVGVIYGHGDIVAGLEAALATMAALEYRADTGRGQHVDLSQLEALAAHMGTSLLEWTALGRDDGPRGNTHPQWTPHGVYQCLGRDRWCAIAVRSDAEWAALCEVLDRADLGADPELADAAGRRAHADLVDKAIGEWTRSLPASWVAEVLQDNGIPAGVVQDGRDLVEHDPQLRARGFYVHAEHPAAGAFLHEGLTVQLADTPGGVRSPAPLLGADTDAVLREVLGMTAKDIERLRAARALD
ncbi:CaiB/BaiF CoA-transferase family protein [Amycolatopsis aidingensis]|uniref:CaiB/BaiF CoA-transferase family protein n=1 Tax=Amycolatopsis aidingensis TaxID=2842453 RepID=UPI001C0C7160|nr:CoA transferase [Amycolatopsis aidingensis]